MRWGAFGSWHCGQLTSEGAVVFQFEVPAEQFKPGTYTCQINIIDAAASKVSFPRLSFAVMN